MIRYRADWVLPIARPPIRGGRVTIDRGRIVSVGDNGSDAGGVDVDLGHAALMPGLVNAHTHLELSFLRGQVPPADDFVVWVRQVVARQRARTDPKAPEVLAAIEVAIDESLRAGTVLVGDITNTLATFAPLAASQLAALVLYELIRFRAPDPAAFVEQAERDIAALAPTRAVRASLAAHAPYSVAPSVFRAIRTAVDADAGRPYSVHLAESPHEVDFIRTGGGAWRTMLENLGSWDPAWSAPGGTPVEYLDDCGFLSDRLIAVHGVQMTPEDLARLAAREATLVTCPRSNVYTGVGTPPIAAFYESGVRVAVGTDSLASAPDLNVFAELAAMRRLAPDVAAASLLDSATRQGARALGFDADFGTIEAGKSARLIAVEIPAGVEDVEEYLVNGIEPNQVSSLES